MDLISGVEMAGIFQKQDKAALIEFFILKSREYFNFLVTDHGFGEKYGIVDFSKTPPVLVDIDYENIPDFFWICNEFQKDGIKIELAYGPKGQATGRKDEFDLVGNFNKGEKYAFRISDLLKEYNIIDEQIDEMNIVTTEKIDKTLTYYKDMICNNIDTFLNPDEKILKSLLKKREQHQKEVLKKLGYD